MSEEPRVVVTGEFSWLEKLGARIGFHKKLGKLFLGYCNKHKQYFLDYEHTKGEIRCPTCDSAWLKNHSFNGA